MAEIRRLLTRLVWLFRASRAEADLAREMNAHLQLLEDQYIARGMSTIDARYAARRAFGGVEQAKERQRDARTFRALAGWPMDLKLGTRMLRKSPGLTIIGVFALAVAIGGGAAYMEFLSDMVHPTLPIPQGDRIVSILNWDTAKGDPEPRALYEFAIWREEVRSIEDLGAYVPLERNLITDTGGGEPVLGVEISAAAFRIVPTPPLLGRPLLDADESPGAPPVVVISQDVWRSRLGGDPGVIGRTVRLGRAPHTIVGVMPAGFAFPSRQQLWVPLKLQMSGLRRADGPRTRTFGRLASGVTLAGAQAELDTIGARINADASGADQQLVPRVMPYIQAGWASKEGRFQVAILYSANVFFLGLLALCGANVATLVFARTATRQGEITVRTALGASRGRIIAQLFAEALVLSALALGVGLLGTRYGVEWVKNVFLQAQEMTSMPFWWNDALTPTTIVYASLLALLAAAIVGVVPALKATGSQMQGRLKDAAAGGSMKFGGIWTVIIVAQVAITVVFLASVLALAANLASESRATRAFTFNAKEFLTLTLVTDRDAAPSGDAQAAEAAYRACLRGLYAELQDRLSANSQIGHVTYANTYPGRGFEFILDVEGMPQDRNADDPLWVRSPGVAPNYFDALGVPILAGRNFTSADVGQPLAIVDETFVRRVLGARDPIGIRVRRSQRDSDQPGPWLQIVGVVRDLSLAKADKTSEDAMLYRALTPDAALPLRLTVQAKGDPAQASAIVRRAAAETDPTLRVYDLMSLERIEDSDIATGRFFVTATALIACVALVLATAGIYALLSFTLTRRTREIGIRAALGAAPGRIVTALFSRTFIQVGIGVLIGSLPGGVLLSFGLAETAGESMWRTLAGTAVSALFVLLVAMLTCIVPVRRALRIQPTEALRIDG
jgi:putative ABC transport system permease protein